MVIVSRDLYWGGLRQLLIYWVSTIRRYWRYALNLVLFCRIADVSFLYYYHNLLKMLYIKWISQKFRWCQMFKYIAESVTSSMKTGKDDILNFYGLWLFQLCWSYVVSFVLDSINPIYGIVWKLKSVEFLHQSTPSDS